MDEGKGKKDMFFFFPNEFLFFSSMIAVMARARLSEVQSKSPDYVAHVHVMHCALADHALKGKQSKHQKGHHRHPSVFLSSVN